MAYVNWKIEHAPYNGTTGTWGSTTEITGFFDVVINTNLGDAKDTFQFSLSNSHGKWNNFFNVQDKITIYRKSDTTSGFTSTDVVMIGALKDVPTSKSGLTSVLKLSGYNFSEAILGAIVFTDPQTSGYTIPYAIKQALDNASGINSKFAVSWKNTNPLVKTDGTAFPVVNEKFFYKPIWQIVEKYSTKQATGDIGPYKWFVNNANEFVWVGPNYGTSYTFNTTTDLFTDLKTARDIKEVRNYFILKGGRDPADKPIQIPYANWVSVAKHGIRYYYYVESTVNAESLNKADLNKSYGTDVSKQVTKFPTFPFTTSWVSATTETVESITMTNGSPVTIPDSGNATTNQQRYTAVLRAHVKAYLKQVGQRLSEMLGLGKLKIDIEVPVGTYSWQIGDRISVTIPELNYTNKELKVCEIELKSDFDTYSLEEVIGTI